jgi:hypothetical protein
MILFNNIDPRGKRHSRTPKTPILQMVLRYSNWHSGTPTETPDTPTETLDTPTETPDTPTETPDTPTETPDTPECSGVSGVSVGVPEFQLEYRSTIWIIGVPECRFPLGPSFNRKLYAVTVVIVSLSSLSFFFLFLRQTFSVRISKQSMRTRSIFLSMSYKILLSFT